MNKSYVIHELDTLPSIISDWAWEVNESALRLLEAKREYDTQEAWLYASGEIDGKNAEIRKVQLISRLERYQVKIDRLADEKRLKEIDLEERRNRFLAVRSIARLLSGDNV